MDPWHAPCYHVTLLTPPSLCAQYDPQAQLHSYLAMNLLSGALGGVAALALVYPLDFATIRMAANLGPQDPGEMVGVGRQVP